MAIRWTEKDSSKSEQLVRAIKVSLNNRERKN